MQKPNPLKLNKLQARTLALAQVIARQPDGGIADPATGDIRLARIPHAHGDHVHVGPFVVSARDASGFSNPAVWVALARKGLVRSPQLHDIALTPEGQAYDTGLGKQFLEESDH
ncbi:hypothetical protein [Pacificispira sp.]|uniref:hypothetical protein n=1 Tax=Pacificispira sp. TaxID=2888761 RepID=UPI003BAC62BF